VHGAFTLVELMVVMAIMAILAAAMALAVAGAQEAAQIAKTRSLIARLNALVMQKYESYRTRRLPITMPGEVLDPANGPFDMMGNPIPKPTPLKALATIRCDVIRQLMRMEMPERWTDLDAPALITVADNSNPAAPITYNDVANPTQPAVVSMLLPAVTNAYWGQVPEANQNGVMDFTKVPNAYEGAKCLYLMMTIGMDDPDIMENFSEGDIGDYDHSGHKVFLDAWGKPIGFLRWAPAFYSPLQPAPNPFPASPVGGKTYTDGRMPDQTDPTGIYGHPIVYDNTTGLPQTDKPVTFALYPLIYSAGPDGYFDMVSKSGKTFHYVNTSNPRNNPFASLTDTTDFPVPPTGPGPIGTAAIFDDQGNYLPPGSASRSLGISDNITNQLIGAR
jgi:prepilin-type N-terminal cleavage/methylation domain-containing protein